MARSAPARPAFERRGKRSRRAFTLIEVLVCVGIVAVLLAILLPAMERVRHRGYIDACASNLRQLGLALSGYANENRGALPRTIYVADAPPTAGTGAAAPDPFGAGAPAPNDVTAALWLLARSQRLPTALFVCPYDDVNEFEADKGKPADQSNFTSYRKNLGYSFANPYPNQSAVKAGYRATIRQPATFALMADLNPGVNALRRADVYRPRANAATGEMRFGNSDNHEREGQNVLYADGHVSYEVTCLAGTENDNLYTARDARSPTVDASPAGPGDSVLLPAD